MVSKFIDDLITAMCICPEQLTEVTGKLMRGLADLHTRRPDDDTCDSCGVPWPCWWIIDLTIVAGHHTQLPVSAWPR